MLLSLVLSVVLLFSSSYSNAQSFTGDLLEDSATNWTGNLVPVIGVGVEFQLAHYPQVSLIEYQKSFIQGKRKEELIGCGEFQIYLWIKVRGPSWVEPIK